MFGKHRHLLMLMEMYISCVSFGPLELALKVSKVVDLIQIHGTFLYGKFKGKQLIATSVDTNGQIFPLAFAIVEEESIDS